MKNKEEAFETTFVVRRSIWNLCCDILKRWMKNKEISTKTKKISIVLSITNTKKRMG